MIDKTDDKKIIFRCDSYEDIGTGHLIRCLSIAKKIYSHKIYFLTELCSSNHLIKNNGFNILLKENCNKLIFIDNMMSTTGEKYDN